MEQSKEFTQSQQLGLPVDKEQSNMIERQEVKETPFTLVKHNEKIIEKLIRGKLGSFPL